MIFLLIYLFFQGQFLFKEVNGNEEDIAIFFTNTMRCVQTIIRETNSMGHDSMVLERLFCELNGYTQTIYFFFSISQQLGNSEGSLDALEALYACFCSIINSLDNSRSLEMRQRIMFTSRVPPTIRAWTSSVQYTT